MRIAVTLLVRDEIDVVAATIEHYRAAGATVVIVTDNGSIDGTTELLERYQRRGVVDLIREPSHTYDQAVWVTRMARRAATVHGADWVVNVDADEFLWPAAPDGSPADEYTKTSLTDVFARIDPAAGTITVHRQNLLADPDSQGLWPHRLVWRERVSLSEAGTPIAPKVVHRGDPEVQIPQGNHAATGPAIGAMSPDRPLMMYHVPDRGYAQFERKIRNGGSAYRDNTTLPENVGWHWRADYDRLLGGTLPQVWKSRQLTRELITRREAAGDLTRDRRVLDRIAGMGAQAVLSADLATVMGRPRRRFGFRSRRVAG